MTAGYVNGPGQGEAYWVAGTKATIKGPHVIEFENPPGWHVPLHVHDDEDEVHYYLAGSVTVRVGDQSFVGTPGTLAFLPKGVPHALSFDEQAGPGRWLWLSPEDRAGLAREAGAPAAQPEPADGDLDMDHVMGVFARYGMRFLEE